MFTTNATVDLCDGAMDASEAANRATDLADQEGTGSAHQAAAESHTDAAEMHDRAAVERDGSAALAHGQMAQNHRSMARQHGENAQWFRDHDGDDSDDGGGDDGDGPPVQNSWLRQLASALPRRPSRGSRPQLVTNARHQSEAIQRLRRDLVGTVPDEPSRLVGNCSCGSRREDLLIPPTLDDVVRPVENAPQTNEFNAAGLVAGRAKDDALVPLTLNFRATPPLGVPGYDDRAMYPRTGERSVPNLTSGQARIKPTVPDSSRSPYQGQDVSSYPRYGTTGDQGSSDSAGDEQDDEGAPAGRGAGTRGPKGSRSTRGKTVSNPVPQYGDAPVIEDRTEGQRGQFHTAGSPYGPVYAADFFAGNRPLPTERYNEDELVLPPSPDWAEWSRTWPKMGRPQ